MDVLARISDVLADRPCLVGLGNYFRRDDAVGCVIADGLKQHEDPGLFSVVNVEDVIESYVFSIAGMDCGSVLLLDAVEAEGEPGSVIFGRLSEIEDARVGASTHKLALALCGKILEEQGKPAYLLGIVPRTIDFGQGLTPDVEKSAALLKEFIIDYFNKKEKETLHEH